MIDITLDKASQRKVATLFANLDGRVARAEELFLLEIAGVLRAEVQGATPKVVGGGKGRRYPYAAHMQMAGVEGMPNAEAAVAVWVKSRAFELRLEDQMRTLLLVQPRGNAPRYVAILAGAGLWPADMLPFQMHARQATLVARHVRADEAQAVRRALWDRRGEIAAALKEVGAPPFSWGKGGAVGQRVYVDLAWEALRNEFGWGDTPAHAVWRLAIKKMMAHVPVALRKVADFLIDGNERRFDVRASNGVSWRKVRSGMGFQKVLMPFVPRHVNAR